MLNTDWKGTKRSIAHERNVAIGHPLFGTFDAEGSEMGNEILAPSPRVHDQMGQRLLPVRRISRGV